MMTKSLPLCFAILLLSLAATHANVERDWAALLVLDAGPKKKPSSKEETVLLARNHFLLHRRALEQFLQRYPSDPRAFDAKMKLAAILAAEGKMDSDQTKVDAALKMLGELEATTSVSEEKRADVGFQRATLLMQRVPPDRGRDIIVAAAKRFAQRYPDDRRSPRLLVEAATVCDDKPELKRELLMLALPNATDTALKSRIDDDLKRLDLLDKPLEFKMPTLQGPPLDLETLRGSVVMLIFWAADSPHSKLWLRDLRANLSSIPQSQVKVVTVNLDTDKARAQETLALLGTGWPTAFDGKGWEGPEVRALGINALPTVWILDKKGALRVLNAKSNYLAWIQQLVNEP